MLKIMEIDNNEKLIELRQKEDTKHDYLYILKYCNQIKMSDNGELKNFTNVMICNTQQEYDEIIEKEDILYLVNLDDDLCRLYFNTVLMFETTKGYTDEDINTAIIEVLASLEEGDTE